MPILKQNKAFILGIFLLFVSRSVIADWSLVPSGSMQPTIEPGDYIWINKRAYDLRLPFSSLSLARTAEPQRGDIVIFDSAVTNKRMVKRVAALPGDIVGHQNGAPIAVPEDHIFVLGDNRGNSADSRVIGFIPRQEIRGKATHVVVSFNPDNHLIPRAERWFKTLL